MLELQYHENTVKRKEAFPNIVKKASFAVGILGLEPRMTGPESVVLPLHHIPIFATLNAYSDKLLFLIAMQR